MKKAILLKLFLGITIISSSQSFYSVHSSGNPSGNFIIRDLGYTNEQTGQYYLAGFFDNYPNENYILKLDHDTLTWAKRIGRPFHIENIEVTNDKGICILGLDTALVPQFYSCLKLDSMGYIQWHDSLMINATATPTANIREDEHGNLFVLTSAWESTILYKIHPDGNIIWYNRFWPNHPIEGAPDNFSLDIHSSPNGTIYVTGITEDNEMALYSFKKTGQLRWMNRYHPQVSPCWMTPFCVKALDDNLILVAGNQASYTSNSGMYLMKIDSSGALLQYSLLPGDSIINPFGIFRIESGDILLTGGYFNGPGVMRIDFDLTLGQQTSYTDWGMPLDMGVFADPLSVNRVLMVKGTGPYNSFANTRIDHMPYCGLSNLAYPGVPLTYDTALISHAAYGMLNDTALTTTLPFPPMLSIGNLYFEEECTNNGVTEFQTVKDGLAVSPNPSNGVFVLSADEKKISMIRVTDLNGHVVFSQPNINSDRFLLDLQREDQGIYLIEAITNAGMALHTKVLLEK